MEFEELLTKRSLPEFRLLALSVTWQKLYTSLASGAVPHDLTLPPQKTRSSKNLSSSE